MKKLLLLLSFVIFASSFCYSVEFNSAVSLNITSNSNQTVDGTITLANADEKALVGTTVLLQIYSEEKLVKEKLIENNFVLPNSNKKIEFSFEELAAGNYVCIAELRSGNKKIGVSTGNNFSVEGIKSNQKEIISKVEFPEEGVHGIGFTGFENEEFMIEFSIKTTVQREIQNLTMVSYSNEKEIYSQTEDSIESFEDIILAIPVETEQVCISFEEKKECFDTNLTFLLEEYKKANIDAVEVELDFEDSTGFLTIILKGEIIDAGVIVFSEGEEILNTFVKGQEIASTKTFLGNKNATIIIDDFVAKKQVSKEFEQKNVGKTQLKDCTGFVCGQDEVCPEPSFISKKGVCCPVECVPALESEDKNIIPIIFLVAIIFLIIAIFVVYSTVNKKVKK